MAPPSATTSTSTTPIASASTTATTSSTSANDTPVISPAPSPIPPPVPVETHPNRGKPQATRLAPEDAFKPFSPPRLRPVLEINGSAAASLAAAALRPAVASLRAPPAIPPVAARLAEEKRRAASRRRKQPHVWKKLLWIKQHGFPDNYTDTETFLDHLQRNPRLRPYDFWPLVADSAVIVQHVCSVAIYICAYAGIYQGRLSPVAVVTCGTIATLVSWILWDHWIGQEEAEEMATLLKVNRRSLDLDDESSTSSAESVKPVVSGTAQANGHTNTNTNGHVNNSLTGRGMGLRLSTTNLSVKDHESKTAMKHTQSLSKSSFQSISPIDTLGEMSPEPFQHLHPTTSRPRQPQSPKSVVSSTAVTPGSQARRKTFRSACLIYFVLLGLSPILKSLTKSTSSDSIWALATWLLIINIFFFDYGSIYIPTKTQVEPLSPGAAGHRTIEPVLAQFNHSVRAPPFPSSLSTNAALMASTVLASRLRTSTAVFSLTLFSIQVFGLFPVFRRHLRHKSFNVHLLLTLGLVGMSTCGLGLILSQSYTHTYGNCGFCLGWIWHVILRSTIGLLIGGFITAFVMGGCSWWLIGLQRYKNVVIGPWDPAKPVLAGGVYGRSRTGTD
ncbi:phosphatidylinositol glycan, class C [Exophiala aquamarina CBS 119918]|uniref:Phosphatidylinositol glycan, class C n=1 Tax=Exophiala aquamarina CBS 119918 TaxID=1182545 RepID=A0A072PFW8_9EURO|nr:phosphatidylinositol glycan, class C [Exophiala aquamarina CBS 119918]KEF58736.1 phosphatidylinositol glycan, class C [Exophiala aquamarina CBS 119918]